MATTPQPNLNADHHYVPKFYLKGFMDKSHALWVYEKGTNAPRQSTPKKEGNRENYYRFTDRGVPDDSTEQMLSKAENQVAPTIRKLANPLFQMNDIQRSELFAFVALTYVRVPAFRDFIDDLASNMMKQFSQDQARDRDKFHGMLRDYEVKTGQSIGDFDKFRNFLLSGNYTITQQSKGYNLLLTFQMCLSLAAILETEYRHDIYYAPADLCFITCDNPIVTIEPDTDGKAWVGMGIGRLRTEVIFPLNKRACLILSRMGNGKQERASPLRVEQINNIMMSAAQKFAYAPVGYRRLSRIFNERGCKIKYGANALMHQQSRAPDV